MRRAGKSPPTAQMDRLSRHSSRRRGAPYRGGDPHPYRSRGRAASRLLSGPFVGQHDQAGHGRGRICLLRRHLRRRPPYWLEGPRGPQLIVPTRSIRTTCVATAQGFNTGDQFYAYLKDRSTPSMPRARSRRKCCRSAFIAAGRPARPRGCAGAVRRLCLEPRSRLDSDPARHRAHWIHRHPPPDGGSPRASRARCSSSGRRRLGASPWVAAAAWEGLPPGPTPPGAWRRRSPRRRPRVGAGEARADRGPP